MEKENNVTYGDDLKKPEGNIKETNVASVALGMFTISQTMKLSLTDDSRRGRGPEA